MSLLAFDVLFDNPHATFYCGQQVTGRVVVNITKEKKIRGIGLRFRGETEVKWSESRTITQNGKSHTKWDHYRSHELYFDNHVYLVGNSNGEIRLPAGEHIYPFVFNLPVNIPSSFEGARGYVRYTVKAKIDRPWKFDHECKTAFTVLTPLDLNCESYIQDPATSTKEKFLCCMCCKQGPITLVANIPFRGFVPGQNIQAVVEVDNISRETVNVKCSLVKHVKFTASHGGRSHNKHHETIVAEERVGEVQANKSNTWTTNLLVPSLPASHLIHCNCIDISYEFVIKGQFSGAHKSMHVHFPVVIGTIPLRVQFPAIIPSAPMRTLAPDMPPPFSEALGAPAFTPSAPPPDPLGAYPDMPPPSYEECMLGRTNIRTEDDSSYVLGPMDFAPRYPLYKFKGN